MAAAESSIERGVNNYINTLIFCIVAKGITVLLLLLLLLPVGQQVAYTLLTVEICMIVVVVTALLRVVLYERKLSNQMKDAMQGATDLSVCPDYYTRRTDEDGNVHCSNVYATPDGRLTYTMGTSDQALLSNINLTAMTVQGKKTLADVCSSIRAPAAYGSGIAWTDLKPKCT